MSRYGPVPVMTLDKKERNHSTCYRVQSTVVIKLSAMFDGREEAVLFHVLVCVLMHKYVTLAQRKAVSRRGTVSLSL